MLKRLLGSALVVTAIAAGSQACSAQSDDAESSSTDEALLRTTAVSRAMQWVNAKLQYCQAAYHGQDHDTSCSPICDRQENPAWDPYRSDCSGLVDWAWGISTIPNTEMFAPADDSFSHVIAASDLEPGDAINKWTDHIVLFDSWIDKGNQTAWLIEEPGCSTPIHWAHRFQAQLHFTGSGSNVTIDGYSGVFVAIRYNKITNPTCKPAPPPPTNPSGCDAMQIGEGLGSGDVLRSCSGQYALELQKNGNLVLYDLPGNGVVKTMWATGTTQGHNLKMQSDGNLVLYDTCGVPQWSSGTHGHPNATVHLQGDGNLVIYGGDGTALWSTGT